MPARETSRVRSAQLLARYRSMRDFEATAEPRGERVTSVSSNSLPFVVQKHAASRLHYDFRLAWHGVLKSWAVAKGPSDFPGDKRLAVRVEDHPHEYRTFEGIIPAGQYGGGTVMVWDEGVWQPDEGEDVDDGLARGHLKFHLHGKKLKGRWALVRMHGRAGGSKQENWLLIKEKDHFARASSDPNITDTAPNSAVTRRSLDQIAHADGKVWNSNRNSRPKKTETKSEPAKALAAHQDKRAIDSTRHSVPRREHFPGFIAPQLAQPVTALPAGDDWIHELKLDGYRIQIHIQSSARGRRVSLFTRSGLDWSARMPDIAHAAARLPVENAILDGEAVALDDRGISSFAALQAAFREDAPRYITYFAFDLLYLDDHSLRRLPLLERKRKLAKILKAAPATGPLRFSEHIEGDGPVVFNKACKLGAEGIVSKRAAAPYVSARNGAWLKLKCVLEQELVIGGFTIPSNGSNGVGALLLGYYDHGKLHYAGRSGTGFTQSSGCLLRKQLNAVEQRATPFHELPAAARKGAHWVKPSLVAQIAFANWTTDGRVRQASFKGLREDKPAREVVREAPVSLPRSAQKRASHGTRPMQAASKARPSAKQTMSMTLALTHPDKVLDTESGLTKQSLAEYYLAVAQPMLAEISGRPLSIVRCPAGSGKPCFFQKHIGAGLPEAVHSISIPNRKIGEREEYLTVDSPQGLVGLAQIGVLEIHAWGSRNKDVDKPDRIVFDLDPDVAIPWKTLAAAAIDVRARLRRLGLTAFLKSTGGKGLHVVLPIAPEHAWPEIKTFAHNLVLAMERDRPELYITKMTKSARADRIYLDYLRNDREATSVAPWSPRARSGAPVAMPLQWKELEAPKMPRFHVTDFSNWRTRLRNNPWKRIDSTKQMLPVSARFE